MLGLRRLDGVQSKELTVIPETESSDGHLAESESWAKDGKVSHGNRTEKVEEKDREARFLQACMRMR